MKVIIVGPNKPIGGISSHVRSLSKGLKLLGDDVTVIPKIDVDDLHTYMYYASRFVSKSNVIHIHGLQNFNPLLASLVIRRIFNTHIVVTAHGFGGESYWWNHKLLRSAMKLLVNQLDLVVTISEFVRYRLIKFLNTNQKMVTIYNGVDTDRFDPSIDGSFVRSRLSLENKFVVLFVGRLAQNKGLFDLLDAIYLTSGILKNIHLIICGHGKLYDLIQTRIRRLGIDRLVSLEGLVSESVLPLYYACSDVVCVPSTFEPFGLVPVEAMSMSKPVIASKVGGIPESVVDQKTGILIPPNSPKAISDAILELANDPSLRTRMGTEGRKIVKEKFSLESMCKTIHEYYLSLV